MPDNADLPLRFKVIHQIPHLRGNRVYQCRYCSWQTGLVRNGTELHEQVRQGHFCFPG